MSDFQTPARPGEAAALPKGFVQHPLSAAFPRMTPEEFQELKDSIEVLGVQNPITLHDGMVIDGWHRYSAARELDLPCPVVNLAQDIDPRDFVMAQNKARRHVTKAQLAIATTAGAAWAVTVLACLMVRSPTPEISDSSAVVLDGRTAFPPIGH